jgi:hypothetical protein
MLVPNPTTRVIATPQFNAKNLCFLTRIAPSQKAFSLQD